MDASFLDQILDKVSHLEGMTAYVTIYGVLLACGLGIPIPEDITIVTAGYLAYLENIELPWGMVACILGVLSGDFVLFMLGRTFGRRLLKLPGVRFVATPERITYAQSKLKKNVKKICFTARFLAGFRAPIYLSAGMLGVPPLVFLSMDFMAVLISVPVLSYLGYLFGDEIDIALGYIRRTEKYIIIALAILGAFFILKTVRRRLQENVELKD